MGREAVIETYEEKRARIREFNLTSDLFASKVFGGSGGMSGIMQDSDAGCRDPA